MSANPKGAKKFMAAFDGLTLDEQVELLRWARDSKFLEIVEGVQQGRRKRADAPFKSKDVDPLVLAVWQLCEEKGVEPRDFGLHCTSEEIHTRSEAIKKQRERPALRLAWSRG